MSIIDDYTVQSSGICRKCGTGSSVVIDHMASFGSPVFPGHIDQGLSRPAASGTVSGTPTFSGSSSWGCFNAGQYTAGTCYEEMSNLKKWTATAHVLENGDTGRVWGDHDVFIIDAVTTMSGLSGTTLSGMLTLNDPYDISEAELQQYQNNIQPYMSFENVHDMNCWSGTVGLSVIDSELCSRILRNVWECPTYWGGEGYYLEYLYADPPFEGYDTNYMGASGSGFIPYGLPVPTLSGAAHEHILTYDSWPVAPPD